METSHRVYLEDSGDMSELEDESVDLVVTSPPYPLIEMWDELFSALDPAIADALERGDGYTAFDLMHATLRNTWESVTRVLKTGGIACINVGDATRKVDSSFRVYQNHARIIDEFERLGFDPLPDILWRKPVNSGTKFMGSGMLPPNAYATLEHEYLLIFRKGDGYRSFEPNSTRRYQSAYFWEERNEFFSDVWTDVTGRTQSLGSGELRDRSGAFPLEIPYRLVTMYSVYGDTVLDPFWGTGTTSIAAMVAGRNSVGYELEREFAERFEDELRTIPDLSQEIVDERVDRHRRFVEERRENGGEFGYVAEEYDLPVM
ncbi:MAG: DNA-methyltransferase, partial [Halodesulfurarchaeum sp.]